MRSTIDFFKELSSIPRESGNETKIADYIERFAQDNNLDYQRDELNNIIIFKYIDGKEPIILQSHLDMVCVKFEDKDFDFNKDSIEIIEKDGYLCANGTTLGADNGIGVAQILNILANYNFSIEAIFTTNEETTMEGAMNIDLSKIKGRRMLNLDGFKSDTILIESASFTDLDIKLNYNYEKGKKTNLYKISIDGLKGGHSGFDIDDDRGNAIILLSQILLNLDNVKIADFVGGTKINVIPSSSYAIIETSSDLSNLDSVEVEKISDYISTLSIEESSNLLKFLSRFRHGVFSKNNRGEVTTSMNLATINLRDKLITVGIRSSNENKRQELLSYLKDYCNGFELIIRGYQPGFRTSEDSIIVKRLIESYKSFNLNVPRIESVHISVEVGLLVEKIPELDVAIISPNIIGAHSTEERVEIDSIFRCDQWLISYLTLEQR